ncbi:Maf family protein [Planctobacterium marinum]|uniref:Maf family protein n=1 Tax=Planctobacterium marinum TaxID=1631968 RepID=UPI001E38ED46|nr:Maf family protein [Planctobacterium marinum]MCC2608035.1 Maf family protein [Planctobacterium marinum]
MIVLASASPRRAQLLQQVAIEFERQSADIDETPHAGESATALVERLAREKAEAVAGSRRDGLLVLGADTIGLLNDDILVKPKNVTDFRGMMRRMSGQTHKVITAIAVAKWCSQTQQCQVESGQVSSEVTFKILSEQEIAHYWSTGEPADKAGGYAIQGYAGQFVTHIAGSYSAIVGLPLCETVAMLNRMKD